MTDQHQNEIIRDKLITLMEKWLDLAEHPMPMTEGLESNLEASLIIAYKSGYESALVQAVRDLSELLQDN